jgi:hypothetical protein
MGVIASYNTKVIIRAPADALPDDQRPEPLAIGQLTEAFEEAVRKAYWDLEPGGQSVDVNVTAERTDI